MKYNADVNLRQRARRKWFILLGCAVVAGGLWFRADLRKKQAAARFAPTSSERVAEVPGTDGADGSARLFLDESMEAPFVVPGIGFAEFESTEEDGWMTADYTQPIRFGLASSAGYSDGFGFGATERRTGVAISVSGGSTGAVTIGPEVTDLARPQIPQVPAVQTKAARLPQTLPQPR